MTRPKLLYRLTIMNKNFAKRSIIQRRTIIRYTKRAVKYLYPPDESWDWGYISNQITLAKELKNLRYTTNKGEITL